MKKWNNIFVDEVKFDVMNWLNSDEVERGTYLGIARRRDHTCPHMFCSGVTVSLLLLEDLFPIMLSCFYDKCTLQATEPIPLYYTFILTPPQNHFPILLTHLSVFVNTKNVPLYYTFILTPHKTIFQFS